MMLALAQPSLAENLRQLTARLRSSLEALTPSLRDHAGFIGPDQMHELLSELMQAGTWLRAEKSSPRDPDLDAAVADYREAVALLRDLLPQIHRQLLCERARLEAERTRVESAAEWAEASRQTL